MGRAIRFHAASRSSASRRRPSSTPSGVADGVAEPVLVAEAVHPRIALVGQLEQLGERRGERHRITLAWDSLSHVSGALACGVAGICAR